MKTREIDNLSQSYSSSEDSGLFQEVLVEATRTASLESSPERTFDNGAAGGILYSYKFVTESRVSDSSSSRSELSTSASQAITPLSQTTYRPESLGSSRSFILPGSRSYDGSHEHVSRSPSRTIIEPLADDGFDREARGNRTRVTKPDNAAAVQPTTSEVWGWLLCEVGMSGFKAILWVFFPLLIFSLFAASSSFLSGKRTVADTVHCPYNVTDPDPRCLKVCDSFTEHFITATTDSLGSNATRCVQVSFPTD